MYIFLYRFKRCLVSPCEGQISCRGHQGFGQHSSASGRQPGSYLGRRSDVLMKLTQLNGSYSDVAWNIVKFDEKLHYFKSFDSAMITFTAFLFHYFHALRIFLSLIDHLKTLFSNTLPKKLVYISNFFST